STKSVRARVANLTEFLREPLTVEDLRGHLLRHIFGGSTIPTYDLTAKDWEAIRQIAQERYDNWEWNFGRSPAFNTQTVRRLEGVGTVDVRLWVEEGIIRSCTVYGDFFGIRPVEELEEILTGLPYRKEDLGRALADVPLWEYVAGLDKETFLKIL
ncbi:MAG: lipoate protein ligase C-terminal domain-containing protein, partial [Bacillota bacterium]|nr:lipoate protein ligase C-terminal domain-containing protein [Bacillota bacterium]